MSSLLQRLQAKIDEYRKKNPDTELSADDEAEIMQKLAEERLPKNTAIVVEDSPGHEDADGTKVKESDKNSQQQTSSVYEDSKVDSAKEGYDRGQQNEQEETPAQKSKHESGKDDGEQQRSDIPAVHQDEILADSAVRPGTTTTESQNAPDEQQNDGEAQPEKSDDAIKSSEAGETEPVASGDNSGPIETDDLDKLKGLEVNSDGTVYDGEGNAVARLIEGQPDELAGWPIGEYGEILDDDGDLVGRVELIKQDKGPDADENATQDSVDDSNEQFDHIIGEDGDTEKAKDEAGDVATDVDGDANQRESGIQDESSMSHGGEEQRLEGHEGSDEFHETQERSDDQLADDKVTKDTASGDSQTKGDGGEEVVDGENDQASNTMAEHDAEPEQTTSKDAGDTLQADAEQTAPKHADDTLQADTEQTESKDAGATLRAETEKADSKDAGDTLQADSEQTDSKSAGDALQADTDAGPSVTKDSTDPLQAETVDKDPDDLPQADAAEEQSPRQTKSGRKPPRKLPGKSKRQIANQNEPTDKADSEAQQDKEGSNIELVDNDIDNAGHRTNTAEEENVEKNQEAQGQQESGEAASFEQVQNDEPSKDSEDQEQSATNDALGDGEVEAQADRKLEQSMEAQPSEDSNKTSGEDENAAKEDLPERQDSGVEDVSESKEKQDRIIGDSQEMRPDPEEDQEEAAGEKVADRDGTVQAEEQPDTKASGESHDSSPQATRAEAAEEATSGQSEEQDSQARSWDEAHAAMDTHNAARRDKGSAALKWDDDLARDAAEFAKRLSKSRKLQHSGVEEHGETVFVSTGEASYDDAVQSWLAEESDFDIEKFGDGNASKYARFTQCVWQNSSHFGIAKATSKHGGTFIVARYWPQGNIVGEKPY